MNPDISTHFKAWSRLEEADQNISISLENFAPK